MSADTGNVGFTLRSSTTIPLTKEVLEAFRALPASPVERDLDKRHVTILKEKIEAGKAIPFNWASAMLNGEEIRINGQHSSEALGQFNGNLPEGLIVHRDLYDVENEHGLINTFRQLDDRITGRTPLDVAGAYAKVEAGLAGIDMKVAKLAAESIVFYDTVIVGGAKVIGDDCYEVLHEKAVHPFIVWLDTAIFSSKTRELAYKPVVAAMWATWQANTDEAKVFWDTVARGGAAGDDTDPASMLDEALTEMKEKARDRPKPTALYFGCVSAWNFHRTGNRPKAIKFDTKKGHIDPVE